MGNRAVGTAFSFDRELELPAIAAAATAATTATTATTTAAFATTTTTVVTTAATTTVVTTATTAVATTATAVTTTATTAAAVATAATAAEATATAAAAARLALLGLVDAERATVEGAAVHALDGLRGLLGRAHGHEREAARAARLAIRDEVDVTDSAEFLEGLADAFSIGVERKIPNVQTSVHRLLDLALRDATNPPQRGHRARKRVSNLFSPLSTGN